MNSMKTRHHIEYTTVSTPEEVTQILALQAANHDSTLSPAEKEAQGFVTVRHDPDVLQRMNQAAPAVIAKDGSRVVGYALVMPRSFGAEVPELVPMFAMLDELTWQDRRLRDHPRWFVMGQICIADGYRGQGLFDGLYAKMQEVCAAHYDFTVTEVAARNTRSLRAHERVGFETMRVYDDPVTGETWYVVGLAM